MQVLDPSSRVSADRASSRLLDRISSMRGVLQSRDDQAGTATFGLFAHGSMTRIPQCTGVPVRECLGRNPGLRGLHMDFRDRGRSADSADLHMDVGNDGSSWNMIVFQELADGWQKQCGARRRGRVFLGVRLSPLKSLCLQSRPKRRRWSTKKEPGCVAPVGCRLDDDVGLARSQMVVDHLTKRDDFVEDVPGRRRPLDTPQKKKTKATRPLGEPRQLPRNCAAVPPPTRYFGCARGADRDGIAPRDVAKNMTNQRDREMAASSGAGSTPSSTPARRVRRTSLRPTQRTKMPAQQDAAVVRDQHRPGGLQRCADDHFPNES